MAEENDGMAALASKNAELLGELKQTRARLKELDGIDIDQLKAAANELQQRKHKELEEGKEYEKLIVQQREDHAKELAAKEEELAKARASVRGVVVDSALRGALAASHVDPVMMDAAVDMLSNKVSVTDAGEERQARIGDKDVKDWVSDWSKSEVGKRFVLAQSGTGGGDGMRTSGPITNGAADRSRRDWEAMFDPDSPTYSMMDQAQLLDKDPKLFEALTKKYQDKVTRHLMGRG